MYCQDSESWPEDQTEIEVQCLDAKIRYNKEKANLCDYSEVGASLFSKPQTGTGIVSQGALPGVDRMKTIVQQGGVESLRYTKITLNPHPNKAIITDNKNLFLLCLIDSRVKRRFSIRSAASWTQHFLSNATPMAMSDT